MSRVQHPEKRREPRSRATAPIQRAADRAKAGPSPRFGLAQHSPRFGFAPVSPRYGRAETPRQPAAARSNGLPAPLKANVEAMSRMAMDDVQVHRNSPRPAALGALAFTRGSEIHLGPGQEQHLPHEAWHVVQQKQGRVMPTRQAKGVAINDDQGLEREADQAAAAVSCATQLAPAATAVMPVTAPVIQRMSLQGRNDKPTVSLSDDFAAKHLASTQTDAETASVARANYVNTVVDNTTDEFKTTLKDSATDKWTARTGRAEGTVSVTRWKVHCKRERNAWRLDPDKSTTYNMGIDVTVAGDLDHHANTASVDHLVR